MHLKLLVLLFLLLVFQVHCEVVYKSRNLECIPSPTYVGNFTCSLKALNWNKSLAQIECYLIKPLRNVSVHIQVLKKDYTNKYQPFLIDFTINMCDVVARRNYFTYGILFLRHLKRFSNVNHSCPIEDSIIIRDMYMTENLFPVFPLGLYRISVAVIENYLDMRKDEVGNLTLTFEAMERIKLRKKKPRQSNLDEELREPISGMVSSYSYSESL